MVTNTCNYNTQESEGGGNSRTSIEEEEREEGKGEREGGRWDMKEWGREGVRERERKGEEGREEGRKEGREEERKEGKGRKNERKARERGRNKQPVTSCYIFQIVFLHLLNHHGGSQFFCNLSVLSWKKRVQLSHRTILWLGNLLKKAMRSFQGLC